MTEMTRDVVQKWLAGYEQAWRSIGTSGLAALFTSDIRYRPSPWRDPVTGVNTLGTWWEGERDEPDEGFTVGYEVLAVDGSVAVVRVEVDYASEEGNHGEWRNLWLLTFAQDGRVSAFEEWPFTPTSATATITSDVVSGTRPRTHEADANRVRWRRRWRSGRLRRRQPGALRPNCAAAPRLVHQEPVDSRGCQRLGYELVYRGGVQVAAGTACPRSAARRPCPTSTSIPWAGRLLFDPTPWPRHS